VSESYRQARLLKHKADSAARVLKDRGDVAMALGDKKTTSALGAVVRPNSPSKTLRKAGVALILAPDPATAVPGLVMLGASFALESRDPMSVSSLCAEARKLLEEIGPI
jgi:hypothetical protein